MKMMRRCSKCQGDGGEVSCHHDHAQAYLTGHQHHGKLASMLSPKVVAVIGATERHGSVGRTCVQNLVNANEEFNNFSIFGVNPSRQTVLGCQCFPSIGKVPGQVDLALIVTPAHTVPDTVEQCGKAGVNGIVVISAGFKELGAEGLALENDVVAKARKYSMPMIGPNCLGVMRPQYGLNGTFAAANAIKGKIAFMSQSGAMCTAVLDWALKQEIGFSAFVSVGSMADVSWGDLIDHLGSDPDTDSILMYMETIGDAAAFLSAAKEVALTKRLVVIKAGRSEAAAKAAASHTGSLAGTHGAFLAAMRRVGVLVVNTIGELFDCALALGKQPHPKGDKLLVITNAGGPGVLATDAVSLAGASMAALSSERIQALNQFLPEAWSHGNPVDVLGDASPEIYAKTFDAILRDGSKHEFDGVLVILSPQSVTDPTATALAILKARDTLLGDMGVKEFPIPIFASWMGGAEVAEGFDLLTEGGIPTYSHPDAAAKTFGCMWNQSQDLMHMTEAPCLDAKPYFAESSEVVAEALIAKNRAAGVSLMSEAESKAILKAYDISVAETIRCASEEDAVGAARQIGYPCVLKLHSDTLTHKSDVGGVKLNINTEDAVRLAYREIESNVSEIGAHHFKGVTVQPMLALDKGIELILGSFVDEQFGPLVMFGSGGCMVEIYKDTQLALPPLNATLAQRLMEDTKVYTALKGGQGMRFAGVDVEAVNRTIVSFSQMVCELSEHIAEIDINPLLALPDRLVALDARVVLRDADTPPPRLAVRPYPRQYIIGGVMLKNASSTVTIRPAHFNDFSRFISFHKSLSKRTIRQRYLADVALEDRLAHQKVVAVCCADYARLIPLIAVNDSDGEMLAICRLTRFPTEPDEAEFKLAVADEWQGRGLGSILVSHAMRIAKQERIRELSALVLEENVGMLTLLERNQFTFQKDAKDSHRCYCVRQFSA